MNYGRQSAKVHVWIAWTLWLRTLDEQKLDLHLLPVRNGHLLLSGPDIDAQTKRNSWDPQEKLISGFLPPQTAMRCFLSFLWVHTILFSPSVICGKSCLRNWRWRNHYITQDLFFKGHAYVEYGGPELPRKCGLHYHIYRISEDTQVKDPFAFVCCNGSW